MSDSVGRDRFGPAATSEGNTKRLEVTPVHNSNAKKGKTPFLKNYDLLNPLTPEASLNTKY